MFVLIFRDSLMYYNSWCVSEVRKHSHSQLYFSCLSVWYIYEWKLLPRGVLWKSCFEKFRTIHRKTLVSESLFNEVAGCKLVDFIDKFTQIANSCSQLTATTLETIKSSSSPLQVFPKKNIMIIFRKFRGKHQRWTVNFVL